MGRHRTEERVILIRLKTKRPERISVMLLQRRVNLKGRKKKKDAHLQKIKITITDNPKLLLPFRISVDI